MTGLRNDLANIRVVVDKKDSLEMGMANAPSGWRRLFHKPRSERSSINSRPGCRAILANQLCQPSGIHDLAANGKAQPRPCFTDLVVEERLENAASYWPAEPEPLFARTRLLGTLRRLSLNFQVDPRLAAAFFHSLYARLDQG